MTAKEWSAGNWGSKKLEYFAFNVTFTCPAESAGTIYRFSGKYFAESGYVTWDELGVEGRVI